MKYAFITVPAAPVRVKPSHRAEMCNQLLFGEAVKILKIKKEKWVKIQSLYDNYTGWITHHMVTFAEKEKVTQPCTKIASGILNEIHVNGMTMHIPAGSFLFHLNKKTGGIKEFKYEYSGALAEMTNQGNQSELLIRNAKNWLNAPYLWGGKTLLGVDCSGFVQTMYKLSGVPMPRDAWQQAQQGKLIKKLSDALPGDLAFFDEKDEIIHVGILLGTDSIIHSAGTVRIDRIDQKGIINNDSGKRTHSLKLIKRFL